MLPGQTLFQSTSRILAGLEPVLKTEQPDMVIVQGDTTTTFCGALAAFYSHVPVGHVEAGLRTGDLRQPFPEEMNRVLTTRLAALHFAPTEGSAENLRREGVPPRAIAVTGNTASMRCCTYAIGLESRAVARSASGRSWIPAKKLIVVTAHRRESFGDGFRAHLRGAGARLAERRRCANRLSGASESRTCRIRCSGIWRGMPISC